VLARIALAPESPRTEAVLRANLAAAEARHEMVRAELGEAESAYARAQREQERRLTLIANNLVSREESEAFSQVLEAAEARILRLSASQQAAQAEIQGARSQLLGVSGNDEELLQTVFSPSDGTVYRIHERNERVIPAGTPLLEISNADALEIVVDLLTQEAVRVETGQTVLINGWGGEQTLQARVRYIEPEAFTKISALGVEQQRVNMIADFIDIPANLGAGYRVEASIIIREINNVLSIPGSAIFQRSDGWNTFVVENGIVELRPIIIGVRNQQYAQVLDALDEGDRVILFPSDLVETGLRVSY